MRIRQTHARCAMECPRMFKLYAIDKRETPASYEAALGTLVHDVIYRYINRCVALGVDNDREAIPGIVKQEFFNTVRIPLKPDCIEEAEKLALNLTEMWTVPPTLGMSEDPMEYEVNGFTFTCRPDCILIAGHSARIHDWKSGRVEFDNDFQQQFYAWMLWRNNPQIISIEAQTFFLRDKAKRPKTPALYLPEQLQAFEQTLVSYFTALTTEGTYPANPNYLCGWCPGLHDCPIPDAYLPPKTPEAALDLGQQYLLSNARNEQIEKQLRSWVTLNGPIETNGAVIGFHGSRGSWGIRRKKEDGDANQLSGTNELPEPQINPLDF